MSDEATAGDAGEATGAAGATDVLPEQVRVLRLGHGANCSSVGSVIDTLFATAVVGGALFAAVAAALGKEDVTVVGPKDGGARANETPPGAGAAPKRDEEAP